MSTYIYSTYIYIHIHAYHDIFVGFETNAVFGASNSSAMPCQVGITLRPALEVSPNNTRCHGAAQRGALNDAKYHHECMND